MSTDPFAGGREVKPTSNAFKLGKPGDLLKGTLMSLVSDDDGGYHAQVKVDICEYHKITQDESGNYIPDAESTVVESGTVIDLWTNKRKDLNTLLEDAKVGEVIAIKFESYEKGKGPKPYKKVATKNFGEDPDYKPLDEYAAEQAFPGSEVVSSTDEDLPFEGSGNDNPIKVA